MLLKKLARPERLELPTYWFEAINALGISNLAIGTRIRLDSLVLLVFKHFEDTEPGILASVGRASMQGVGTELGTPPWGDRVWVAYREPPCCVGDRG